MSTPILKLVYIFYFSILNISNLTRNNNDKRKVMAVIISISVFIIGIPAPLSFNVLDFISFGAGSIFDNMDYLASNILLPLNALTITLIVSFLIKKEILKCYFNNKFYYLWYFTVKYFKNFFPPTQPINQVYLLLRLHNR